MRFPSGENATDATAALWPDRTLTVAGQQSSCPLKIDSVCGKSGRKCCAILDLRGDHGNADMYMCGVLVEIEAPELTTNFTASSANTAKSA
jgi:hypothetical protein